MGPADFPLRIKGFGNVNFSGARLGGIPNTFTVGGLDLFLTSKVSDQFNMVGEMVFEANDENEMGIDIERMLLEYKASDRFSIAAGRYHTAIGYYNAAYHHGAWFQTTTGRPFIFNFEDEGGLLPVHGVGVTMQGRAGSDSLGLRYIAELSNGRRSRSPQDEPVQNVADENQIKAFNLALILRPDAVPGLQTGVSMYRDRLTPEGRSKIDETITAAHIVFQNPSFEWLNEVLFIRHAPLSGEVTTTKTFYTQVSKRVQRYRPYLRYEYVNVPSADAYFGSDIQRLHGPVFGLKFDAANPVAIKLEAVRMFGPARARTNGVTVQLAFTF